MSRVYKTVEHQVFYCPNSLKEGFESEGYTTLGDTISTAYGLTTFKVLSGPLCRLYPDKGKLTPNANETHWEQQGRKWIEYRGAYLSYLVQFEDQEPREITVRWETTL